MMVNVSIAIPDMEHLGMIYDISAGLQSLSDSFGDSFFFEMLWSVCSWVLVIEATMKGFGIDQI